MIRPLGLQRSTFTRNVYLFLAIQILVGFTLDGGIYSVLLNLYLLRLGYGPEFVGLVNSAGLAAFALFSLPAGMLGKRMGIVRSMAWGLITMVVGGVLLPLSAFLVVPWNQMGLILGYAAVMTGLAFFFVNGAPFIMGSTAMRERNRVFSLQMALLSVAAFAGSLLGGRLPDLFAEILSISPDDPAAFRYPLLLSAGLLLPGILAMAAAEDVDPRQAERIVPGDGARPLPTTAAAASMGLVALLVFVRFFQVSGVATTATFFNVYLDTGLQISTARIGLLSALGRLAAVPAALLVPWLSGRWGNFSLVVWAAAGTGLSFLPLALVPHWTAAGVGFVGITALSALRYPAFMVYSMELVAPEQRGTVAGAGETAAGICFSLIALGGGYLVGATGFRPLFLLAALLSLVGSFAFWFYFRTIAQPGIGGEAM